MFHDRGCGNICKAPPALATSLFNDWVSITVMVAFPMTHSDAQPDLCHKSRSLDSGEPETAHIASLAVKDSSHLSMIVRVYLRTVL